MNRTLIYSGTKNPIHKFFVHEIYSTEKAFLLPLQNLNQNLEIYGQHSRKGSQTPKSLGSVKRKKKDEDSEKEIGKEYVFFSNFYEFYHSDICICYFYCCCACYGLLKSAVITMPSETRLVGSSLFKFSASFIGRKNRESNLLCIEEAIAASIQIKELSEI